MAIKSRINPRSDGADSLKDFEPDENETARRYIETTNGMKFTTKTYDPYGLVRIHVDGKDELPKELSGQYTSPAEAEIAIEAYLRAQGK